MIKYYLQDKSYYHGNYMNWWAKNSQGYTANLDNAHQFTADELAEMRSRGMRDTDVAWLCSYIDGKTSRCVNASYCNFDEMKEQESILLSQSNNGWISVDNYLPIPESNYDDVDFKPENFYLIQLKDGFINTACYVHYHNCDWDKYWFVSCTLSVIENKYTVQEIGFDCYEIDEVKYWKPHPQPPKE